MTDWDALPDGWVVWNDEEGGPCVLVYRPDVFDSKAFPPPCVPTIHVGRGSGASRRPRPERGTGWHARLTLEPDVTLRRKPYDTRDSAVSGAVDLATAFSRGRFDIRAAYQVPREEYLSRLEELLDADRGEGQDLPDERDA